MRKASVLLALTCFGAAGEVAACGDESPATVSGTDGGGGGQDGDSSQTPAEDAGSDVKSIACVVTPGAVKLATNGCRLKTTDYHVGAKAETIPRTDIAGGVAWTNAEGAKKQDEQFAEVTLNEGEESAELRISDFGFSIPDNADTWGICVELQRTAPDGGIVDNRITLNIDGKDPESIDWKHVDTGWPTKIVGTHHYGQEVDTWKVDLFPADVNKNTFAARLWVKRTADAGAGPATAKVGSMQVSIWYADKEATCNK